MKTLRSYVLGRWHEAGSGFASLVNPSTEEEIAVVAHHPACVSTMVRPSQLFLDDTDYARLGTRAVSTPPVRGSRHVAALWDSLLAGHIDNPGERTRFLADALAKP